LEKAGEKIMPMTKRELEQKIGDLEAKIVHAMNTWDETVEADSRIEDMACELSTLENQLEKWDE